MKHIDACVLLAPLFALASCGPGKETTQTPPPMTKEVAFQRGHQLYRTMDLVGAEVELKRALAMDSTYVDPLVDLASLYVDLARSEEGRNGPNRLEHLATARKYLMRAEALGYHEADAYDRLCELSLLLDDDRTFLTYAKKNAALYPYDRQYFNLGVAYEKVEDWPNVVRTQKEAAEKFTQSEYLGAYYRQMGRAYMKMDRDQTAERTLEAGIRAVNARLGSLHSTPTQGTTTGELRRLTEDKIGMLLLLKRLHTTYKAPEKLEQVERQLKEAGYTK